MAFSGARSPVPGAPPPERARFDARHGLARPHERLAMEERPDPAPGPGQIRVRVEACGVCRTDLHVVDGELPNPKLPVVPGHEIVGRIEAAGEGVSLETWRAGRDRLARPCRRDLSLLPERARKPLRRAAVHRLHAGRRLRHPCDRGGGFRLSSVRGPRPGRDGAAALRGAHRLAVAENGRGGANDRRLWLRRRRAHHRPGLPLAGAARVRLHAARRRWRSGLRPLDGRRMGGRIGREAARGARRRHPVRPGRGARSRRARRAQKGRAGRLRRHSHERHSRLPLLGALGGAQRRLGRQSHPRRRPANSWPLRPRRRCGRRPRPIRSPRPTRRSTICARASSKEQPFSCPERGPTKPLDRSRANLRVRRHGQVSFFLCLPELRRHHPALAGTSANRAASGTRSSRKPRRSASAARGARRGAAGRPFPLEDLSGATPRPSRVSSPASPSSTGSRAAGSWPAPPR